MNHPADNSAHCHVLLYLLVAGEGSDQLILSTVPPENFECLPDPTINVRCIGYERLLQIQIGYQIAGFVVQRQSVRKA